MTRQLNPAWQRKALSSDHLANISARLPGDGPAPEQTSDGCQVIPFLLGSSSQEWVVQDLCGVLAQRGQHARWQTLPAEHAATAADALLAELASAQTTNKAGFCLLATTEPAVIDIYRFDHVILLVPASLDGVVSAYRRVKQLTGEHTPDIGVVVVGPRDQHAAWRYFRKLAVGTLRFLDIPLLNLGFLPQQVTPAQGPPDHHRQNFLTRISERLLRSGFYSHYHPATTDAGDRQPL